VIFGAVPLDAGEAGARVHENVAAAAGKAD